MSDLVGNPEDRFSRFEAHLELVFSQEIHTMICYHMYMYYQNHIFCYCMFKNLCHFSTKMLVYYIVNNKSCNSLCMRILSRDARKPVFGVSDPVQEQISLCSYRTWLEA